MFLYVCLWVCIFCNACVCISPPIFACHCMCSLCKHVNLCPCVPPYVHRETQVCMVTQECLAEMGSLEAQESQESKGQQDKQ